jgi:hypothetical protein
MIRATMLIRVSLLLGVIAATEAAAELAAAQVACAPGYYLILSTVPSYRLRPMFSRNTLSRAMVTLVHSMLGAASVVRTSQAMELTWLRLSASASGMGIADHAPRL